MRLPDNTGTKVVLPILTICQTNLVNVPQSHDTSTALQQGITPMPVNRISYDMITSIYGAQFAQTWFRPVSQVFKGVW